MDINDIYGSISTFWNNISPILFAHLIAFLAIRWTVGSHLNTIERVKGYLATNKYKEWRGVIDEFELRPKLPYVFVIIFLVYLTLFNSLLLQSLDFHPITITYAEMEFWDENRPLDQILEVGTFGKNPNIRIWEINYLKQNFLQEFQAKHPDQYRSSVSWLSDLYGKWFTYYKCSILFLVFTIVLAWIHLRKRKNRSPRSLRRIFALLLFSAAAIGFTRYQAEKYIEKRLLAELSFVGTQVHVDDEAQKNRLDESQIRELRQHLCDELRSAGSRHDQLFWWSRVLERFSLVKRPFSVVSDEDFQRRYGCNQTEMPTQGASRTEAPDQALQNQIEQIASAAKGRVGVSALVLETGETIYLNPHDHFPMQSVYKLPISMAVMKQADQGKIELNQKVRVTKEDFGSRGQHSPIRDKNPNGTELTVDELLRFAISESDGTASDVLMKLAGGPQAVQAYLTELKITNMIVLNTEKEIGRDWQTQYKNWAAPEGAVALLRALYERRELSESSQTLLLKYMTESTPGAKRLKGLLPSGTVVAHKTGTSGTEKGITAATNDIGIITLPNGRHIAIAVFVSDSPADEATREGVIARLAKAVWDKVSNE